MTGFKPNFKKFAVTTAICGLFLWLHALHTGSVVAPQLASVLALLVTCLYGEVRSLSVPGYGFVNFAEGIYFGATLYFGPVFGSALAAVVGLVSDVQLKKRWEVGVFNIGWALCTFCLVGWASQSFQPEKGLSAVNFFPLAASLLAYCCSASLLQAACQTYLTDMPFSRTFRMNVQGMKLGAPAALCLGVFSESLLQLAPWAVVLAIFPIEIFTAYVRVNQLHAELLATQTQLQASSRRAALGVLTAGIAHEINNPLAAMSTSVHLLGRQPLDEKGKKCLNLLSQGIERCRSVTERMLMYSRPPEMRPTVCSLYEVISDAQLFLGNRLKGAKVELDPAIAKCPSLMCDPGALVQIFTNLFTNAADSMSNSPRKQILLKAEWLKHETVVTISDFGTGMTSEVLQKIWEPFFTTKPVGSGTGLGLSISRSLIEAHGGKLEVLKSNQDGTVFQLRIKTT